MKGQKEAVVDNVLLIFPSFEKNRDNALLQLTTSCQLEYLKNKIFLEIVNGDIEYSKDRTNHNEVRAYARSMVMNHLKKAKELNGGFSSSSANPKSSKTKTFKTPKGIDTSSVSEELQEFLTKLV